LSVVRNQYNSNYYDVYIDQYGGQPPANITTLIENGETRLITNVTPGAASTVTVNSPFTVAAGAWQYVNVQGAASYIEVDANGSMLNYLENRRDSISAVSLDEEAANLMQFEKSFQALGTFMGTVNGLLDVLMQIAR
jgi:flagellar hook-associated protein 1 FlgK